MIRRRTLPSFLRRGAITMLAASSSQSRFLVGALAASPTDDLQPRAATTAAASSSLRTTTSTRSTAPVSVSNLFLQADNDRYRTLQVHIVHRHGDRTPITPLMDKDFWTKTLVPESVLTQISRNTHLIRTLDQPNKHRRRSGGRGPFGKLTEKGVSQMVQLGKDLRQELVGSSSGSGSTSMNRQSKSSPLWHSDSNPLHPRDIRVLSTDYDRTIQSVQALLTGLFPKDINGWSEESSIPIDVRHSSIMVPTYAQLAEAATSRPSHVIARDEEMWDTAVRLSNALRPLLGADAINFSVRTKEQDDDDDEHPLEWNQLAEITKCLAIRNLLPRGITVEDQEAIGRYAAWRWSELSSQMSNNALSLTNMCRLQIDSMLKYKYAITEPRLVIWSGHDFTLTGLFAAFQLEQPDVWPAYASYLRLELLQVLNANGGNEGEESASDPEHVVVRFSLNGETLRSKLLNGEFQELIPLAVLDEKIQQGGAGCD